MLHTLLFAAKGEETGKAMEMKEKQRGNERERGEEPRKVKDMYIVWRTPTLEAFSGVCVHAKKTTTD